MKYNHLFAAATTKNLVYVHVHSLNDMNHSLNLINKILVICHKTYSLKTSVKFEFSGLLFVACNPHFVGQINDRETCVYLINWKAGSKLMFSTCFLLLELIPQAPAKWVASLGCFRIFGWKRNRRIPLETYITRRWPIWLLKMKR